MEPFLKVINIRYLLSKMTYVYVIFFSPSLFLFLLVNNSSSICYEILLVMMLLRILFSCILIPLVIDFRLQLNFHGVIIRDNR